ncbi:hypothetical protein G4228_011120 [Cervus hanglu yarkandensis]|nr:hypothetical protein G4228_011120 [Cervus hanglu yarkandensis]
MSGLRRYEVALEAEEEIYWGCFYFFPWLRMWRRERRLHLSQRKVCIHPQNRSLIRWFERQGKRLQGTQPNQSLELIGKMGWDPQ